MKTNNHPCELTNPPISNTKTLNKMKTERAIKRLQEINKANISNDGYDLGDVMLLDKYESDLSKGGWKQKAIENLSPSYYKELKP